MEDRETPSPKNTAKGPGKNGSDERKSVPKETSIKTRPVQLLIAPRKVGDVAPMAADVLLNALAAYPDVRIVKHIRPSAFGALSTGSGTADDVVVAETSPERAAAIQNSAGNAIVVERNVRLRHLGMAIPGNPNGDIHETVIPTGIGLPGTAANSVAVTFKVTDAGGQGIAACEVFCYSGGFPATALTGADGAATVNLPQSTIHSIDFVYVKPRADFWEKWIIRPVLDIDSFNVLTLQPLSSFAPAGFPGNPFFGWGEKTMNLDQQQLTGAGARIGIIDSGCDNTHPALTHVQSGVDYTNIDNAGNADTTTWVNDEICHGTHCAGVICGNGNGGIRGFAPAADVHALKLFPGGRFDSLVSAIKYAIDHQFDVVNCSLGTPESSEVVQSWMERARQAGVAVVVAAGNSSGPVQFPATAPGVLAVSAFGRQGAYPDDTYHAQTVPVGVSGTIGVNGIFAPKFTCHGPEIDVCGPGVAIISSVPGGGYAAWDGTSMAAPHITGLVALLAAHHPEFSNKNAPRNAARVDRLFQTIIGSATGVGLDPTYAGSGVPDTVTAVSGGITVNPNSIGIDVQELTKLIQTVVMTTVNPVRQRSATLM
ncbi:S8 family serine peptidase [Rhizobium leguminosarum bv. viciae]|nr:S8 family serine peptidase [Rhizobium leguminosarum bv. viciae]